MEAEAATQHRSPDDEPLSQGQRKRLGELLLNQKMHPCERAVAILLREGFTLRQIAGSLCMTIRRLREVHESLVQRSEIEIDRPERDRQRGEEVGKLRGRGQITKENRGV